MVTPLRVWLLSDGVPGHTNQALGLLRRIAVLKTVDCQEYEVVLGFRLLRPLLCFAQNRRLAWASRLARWVYKAWPESKDPPQLIVSAGGNTSFINAQLAQQFACANFYMGSLRGLDPNLFTAGFTLQPLAGPRGVALENNIVLPILPSNSEPEEGYAEAQVLRHRYPDHALCAVLLGGDGSGYRYTVEDWQQLAEAMNTLSRQHRVVWLLTTSRRTGRRGETTLQSLLQPQTLAEVVWFGENPSNRNAVFLHAADFVLCSEDSMSMLHEALAANAKVVTFSPSHAKPPARYADKITRLYQDGYVQRCSISALSALQVGALRTAQPHQARDWRLAIERAIAPLLNKIQTGGD